MSRRAVAAAAIAVLLAAAPSVASVAYAEESCSLSGPMMSKEAITKSLHERGYTQIRGLSTHNGCYEAKGIDSKGKRFELELNGATGAIVNAE
ncbi:MAG: PepSY domain-containing protein [Proteobacteria bacterium]|nr:PepSY domain-containing protein [Pseudomonadota bacterium]